jgi:hypothetical protein
MSSKLTGAWELVSDSFNGLAVFTDTHCNITWAAKNRAKFREDEPTDEEAAEAYRTLSTGAGTYEISGETLIFHRYVNRNPNWTGVDASSKFTIDGDQLTFFSMVWRKVS